MLRKSIAFFVTCTTILLANQVFAAFEITPISWSPDGGTTVNSWSYAAGYNSATNGVDTVSYSTGTPANAWYILGTAFGGSSANTGASDIESILGLDSGTVQSVYKYETSPVGESNNYYSTDLSITAPEQSGLITWNTGSWTADRKFLVLKDGNLGNYIFDISPWNGTDDLQWESFWQDLIDIAPGNASDPSGKLSHVELLGYNVNPNDDPFDPSTEEVPEPASIALWASVAAYGAFARRRRQLKVQA